MKLLHIGVALVALTGCQPTPPPPLQRYVGVGGLSRDVYDREIVEIDMQNGDGTFNTGSCITTERTRWRLPLGEVRRAYVQLEMLKNEYGNCVEIAPAPAPAPEPPAPATRAVPNRTQTSTGDNSPNISGNGNVVTVNPQGRN